MPPRYAYWTILIDGKATAFRARDREELLPTFNQLARKNTDIAMRYFTRGKLWDNPEQAQWANRNRDVTGPQSRDRDWRPGGQHKDPRARFEKRGRSHKPEKRFTPRDRPDLPRETRDAQRDPGKSSRDPRDAHRDPHSATRDSRDATRDPRNAPTDSRDAPSDSHQRARSPQNRWQERPANRPFQRPDRDRPKWSGKPEGTSSGSKDQRERPKWEDKRGGKSFQPGDRRERPKWDGKSDRKPFRPQEKPFKPKEKSFRPEEKTFKPSDRREPRGDSRGAHGPGRWDRPPKRKPR